jgi:DNA-directed RNA polymerase sigma subunit (sigma70/sigma32)
MKFDPARGTRFGTFITPWLRHWLARAIESERRQVGGEDAYDTSVRSLDAPLPGDDTDLCLQDVVRDLGTPVEDVVVAIGMKEDVEAALGMTRTKHSKRRILTPREETALRCLFGLDGTGEPRTLRQVGPMLGITYKRVFQLQKSGLTKLRQSEAVRTRLGEYVACAS